MPFLVFERGVLSLQLNVRQPTCRILWEKTLRKRCVHEVLNATLFDVVSLCAPLSHVVRSEIRFSRVDASVSWLCHLGEKPFYLCLCLGCCVSRVFQHSFFVAAFHVCDQSQWQTVPSYWSCRQCIYSGFEHAHERSALEVCWQGTTAQNTSHCPTLRGGGRSLTLQEGHGDVTLLWVHPGLQPSCGARAPRI